MKKILNRVISHIIAITISVQVIGQYGASLIPLVNAVGNENEAEIIEIQNEVSDSEKDVETFETEKEIESVVNDAVAAAEEFDTTTESEYEDWTVTSNTTLNEMKEVNNLTISSGTLNLNEQKVIVHGDLILTQNGILDCNKGEISCENFIMSNSSYLYMRNTNDLIVVNGNFTQNGGYIREDNAVAGTIEIKGDFVSEGYSFNPTKEHKVILSGTTKQTINFRNNSYGFNILEINNTSREGVYSQKSVLANEINLMNNGKINFAGCTEYGKALDDDLVIDGDYYLAAGVLEIGDNEFTVNGNLIQGGGTIKLGTGKLTVGGDYRIQSRIEKENVAEDETEKYNYGSSTGSLEMTSAECSVIVKDNFITQSTVSHRGKLTAGIMEIGKNFEQISSNVNSENFVSTENHTVQFNGKNVTHEIYLSSSSSYFNILDITNTTIDLKNGNVNVFKELKSEGGTVKGNTIHLKSAKLPSVINGDVCLYSCTLESDVFINGNLSVGSRYYYDNETFNLNGNKLTVDGDFNSSKTYIYFNKGEIICNSNCAIGSSSILYQKNAEDKLTVSGNFTYSGYGSSDNMIDGTITIGGNCTIASDNFRPCGEHTIVFNGTKEVQTIKVNSSSSFFNKVVFRGSDKIFGTTCEINSFEQDSKCNVTFYGNGKSGWKLEKNETINGDLYLINGELDLGEYDLTITGNLIQGGGTIKLGTGTLTVNKDYRIQSRTEKETVAEGETEIYNYGSSTGSLEMTSAECSLIVKGNFITQSAINHNGKLTAGTMEIGGNFKQISSNANSSNFISTENHIVKFTGKEKTHVIEIESSSSYFNIFDITNTTIDLKTDNVFVRKELKSESGKIIGKTIYLQNAKLPNVINADVYVYSTKLSGVINGNAYLYGCTLEGDVLIKGNLSVVSRYYYDNETFNLNGNKLTVDGDFNSSKTYIYFNKGEIICNSNCAIGSSSILYQKNVEDKLTVSGNFTYSGSGSTDNMTDGTITIGGNCTVNSDYFKPSNEHTIIFNGTKEVQTIKANSSSSFLNKVVFRGSDKIFGTTCEINSFEQDPKCNVTFYGNGKSGWKLEKNETIKGDLYLVNGELDLGEYDLTITGNLIQGGGTIKLGTGTLTVNKDYRIQSRTEKENVAEGETEIYNYGSSTGSLEMTSAECSLIVKGSFITQSTVSHRGKLTAGTMEIGGNFKQIGSYSDNFYATENHKVILCGKDDQNIEFQAPSNSCFCHLEINNDNSVNFHTDVYINGKIYEHSGKVLGSGWLYVSSMEQIDGYHFSGKVSVYNNNSNQKLEQDLTIGSIAVNYLHVNEKELRADNITVYKGLYVEGGTVNCKNNISFNNESYFTMNVENSYVLVGGNFYNYSYRCSSWELTEGILDIKGDFIQTQNSQFVCKDNHITILTSKKLLGGRDYTQTIQFYEPGKSKFNILRITKPKSKYVVLDSSNKQVSFDLIYNKLEENYTDEIPPTKVNDLEVSDIGSTSAKLSWSPSADNYGVMGYEIHRNGEKIQLTGKTAYTDNHLMPETKYEYTVYAIDESWNYSDISDSVTITTGKDTESPSTPKNLKISSRTGSSITITWSASSDNVGVAGYKIFRGTDEIADIIGKTSYKDMKLEADRQYTYQVKAYDAAGNLSSFCDSVSGCPVMPVIKRITPADASIIGGKTKELQVIIADNGNSTDNKVKFEYKKSGSDKFTPIVDELVDQEKYSSDSLCAKCTWNIYGLENSYIVRVTVYDSDGNFSSKEVEYTLDSAPPLLPKDFVAKTDNGVVALSWSSSISKNCIGYNIYRSNSVNGEYTYLFTIKGSGTEMYQDRSVNFGETYFYKIESIGSYDINSEMSKHVSVTVDEDKMPPTISGIFPADLRINKVTEITAEARDNISVENIHFYYQEKNSEEWHDLKEVSVKNGKASINFVTTDLADGEYTIKAIAQDANKNKSDAATKDFIVDNTGISKIIIDEENCTANSSFVSIRWEDAVESDFGWFAVEKKIGDNNFKEVGTTSQITGMHVENLQPNTAYTFRVVGYDNLGNIGEYSDEITLTTTSDTVKPGISVFRPSSSSFSDKINISITGVDNIGINSLKLRYSYDSSKEKTWIDLKEITSEKKNTSETFEYIFDVSEMPEGEVYVEAEVTDTSGNPGEVCINKFRIDRTVPNAITDLKADGGSGSVHLTWSVSDNDIKSFEIFRCDGEKSDFSKIADCATKDYYDTNVTFNAFYTYKIVAVDTAGNKSQASNYAVTQAEEDTVAPKVYGFSYSSGTVLPSNPKIAVVASDNFKLNHVEISYKKADDPNNIWHDIKSIKMDSSYQSKEFDWVTDGFEEDKYILKAVAYDSNGLSSDPFTAEFTFDFTAPKKPVIELTQGNWKLNLKWSKNTEEDFDFYRVYRKADSEENYSCIGDTRENEYVDNDVTPEKTYIYKIAAYDKTGNSSEGLSANIRPGNVDEIKPQISVDEQLYGVAGYEITFDGSDCTDNVRITNFTWELGNGDTIYGIRNTYTYTKAGTYDVTLTVEDAAGNISSTVIKVVIHDKSKYGNVQVEVVDSSGKPLKSAYVYLYSDDDSKDNSFRTDSNGIVNAALPLGNQKIAAYKDEYLPESADVFVDSTTDNKKIKITLQSGELVTGILEVHRMSLAEMIEAGIDFNNPSNYHSYTFTIELTFAQEPIPTYVEYHYVGGGFGGGGFGGGGFIGSGSSGSVKLSDGSNVQIQPIIYETEEEEDVPILAYVKTTENISFMKDIYAVDLGVINNATSSKFVIKNCTAKLNLPDGLSLAATTKKQTLTQSIDDIAGGQKKTVSWAIKGDKKGQYSLDADFSGTLMPFSAPVKANFKTETPFTVSAGDGINIYVYPESAAYIGKDYYIQFAVKNEGADTFYNLKTSFGTFTNPGYEQDITVIYPDGSSEKFIDKGACYQIPEANECKSIPIITNGQSIRVGIFEPGDVVYGTYKTAFSAPGDPEEVYYNLIDSVVTEWTNTTNVKVHVSPIPSHITKYNVKHEIVRNTWADPVDMTTGGFIDSITPIAVMGESELPFTLNYNSINSEFKGELGYGWSHDYETYLDISGNYINVHWNPTNYATFISENSVIRKVDGTIVNGEIALEESDDIGYKNYLPISTGIDGFKLYRDDDGTYTLTAPGGAKDVFDETGKLIKTINQNGKIITFDYSENSVTITETITGMKLILNYNDLGLITSVSDENGRKALIAYDNELVSRITNVMGESICYSYDENNRLISAVVEGDERPYVINKYDEFGRVIEQDDGDENTPLTYFYYEGEEGGKFTVTATDRNNIHDIKTNKNSHQVTFVSDNLGHVTSYIDQNGSITRYSYDKNGNLITETDAHGNKTSYTYDENNWVTSVKDPSGYVTKMTYDKKGNIASVTGPDGEKNIYTYNLDNLLETVRENSGAKKSYVYNDNAQIVSETVEGLGTKFYEYTNGRLTSVTDFMGNKILMEYDTNGNISFVTDRDGNKTVYKYDALNRIISETTTDGTISYTYDSRGNKTSVTDRRGNTVNYTYDGNNLMTQLETAKGITKFAYDNEGRLTSQTAPDDTISSNVYDAAGHVIKSVNGEGEISEYTYDAVGNVKTISVVNGNEKYTQTNEYYPNGKLKKTTFADGTTQSYEYDKSWRITKITDGLGNSIITEYDSNGNVISMTDAEGNKIEYTYDIYGRILTAKDANGNITTYDEYDANGNCLQATLPSGQVITFNYNNEGMPIQVTTNYKGEDVSIFYEYDAAGRVKKYTDEEGNEFITEYDEAGNITKLFDAYGNTVQSNSYDELNNLVSSTDALGIETQYNYDSVGNLIKTIESINTAREAESGYSYDKIGRLTSVVDAENGTSSYEYDQVGRIIAQIDPNGGRSEYSYDSMGRIIESVTALGSKNKYTYNAVGLLKDAENARGQKTSYTYYKNGWIKSFTDELGTVSYTYDGNGNVLTVTDENGVITREYNEMNLVTKYTDFRGNTIDYSYDQLGNLVALTYPGGRIVRYSYYKNGNIKTVTDWDENVTSYEYDGNGRLTKTTRPDGSVETRTYDKAGRLISQSDVNGEVVICQRDYAYDESGNITSIDTTNAMGVTGLNSAEMVYNENNQLVKYNGETVKYDADGNMIYGPLNGKMAEFKYDCRNRLVSAGGTTYAYDAENNRISKTVDKVKTEYVIDSTGSLTRILTSATDDKTTYYVYGIGLISQEDDSEVLFYHFNNIGSTEAVTNLDGKIQEKFEYGPYGELLSENKCGIIFLYNGEYGVSTDENGLYYMRARYYNPEIKRFINQDVVIGSIADSPSLNRYAYVQGNPISLADPFGLSPGIDWRGAAHFLLGGLSLLTLIPTPVTYIIGATASIVNAALYAEEGNYFAAICNAIPVFGGGFGLVGKLEKPTCWLMKTLQYSTAGLSIGTGAYDIYQIGKENYQKYVVEGKKLSWDDVFSDLFRGGLDVAGIAGGVKLAQADIPYCFVAGTLIATADGYKPIEEIQAGDKVLSENPETGEIAYKTVEETYINETDELIHVHINGEMISATPNHPFYVDKLGWTLAKNLRAGDILVLSNGEFVVVEWIQHEILESPVKVYNFEVEDFHTYFVGESSVLVHNQCTELTRKQQHQIEDLRSGKDVSVKTVDEARTLLDNMPEVSAPPLGRMNPEFPDPKGTYRGDLFNAVLYDDLGNAYLADFIHDPSIVQKNPLHAQYPHYNIYFPDGEKAAILITG